MELKTIKGGRYAYLRAGVPHSSRTCAVYLGKAVSSEVEASLRAAWSSVNESRWNILRAKLEDACLTTA